jgi:hypothetical protein
LAVKRFPFYDYSVKGDIEGREGEYGEKTDEGLKLETKIRVEDSAREVLNCALVCT